MIFLFISRFDGYKGGDRHLSIQLAVIVIVIFFLFIILLSYTSVMCLVLCRPLRKSKDTAE
jgi:uncharacterized membrane protein (DUF485 family)